MFYLHGIVGYGVVMALVNMIEAEPDRSIHYTPDNIASLLKVGDQNLVDAIVHRAAVNGILSLSGNLLTCPLLHGPKKSTPTRPPTQVTKDRKGYHLLADSELNDPKKFMQAFWASSGSEKYREYDVMFYYEQAKNWSAQGNKKKDWVATVRNFILSAIEKGQARKAPVDAPFRSASPKSKVDSFREANI